MWPFGFGNKYPYTDFHELNLDWILDKIRQLEHTVISFSDKIKESVYSWLDEHPEATTTVQDGSITKEKFNAAAFDDELSDTSVNAVQNKVITEELEDIRNSFKTDVMQANKTPFYYSTTLNKKCELYTPPNHTVQSMEYYNGYLYVFHHINDTTENSVSRYSWQTVTDAAEDDVIAPADTLNITTNCHGNSMTFNGQYLIIADVITGQNSVTIVDTVTFSVVGQFTLLTSSFDSCGIVTNSLGTFFVCFMEHAGVIHFYKLVDGYFILMYSRKRTFLNSAFPADIHVASRIYTLHSSVNLDTDYSGMAVYTKDGTPIGICQFSNINNSIELEGMTKVSGDPTIYVSDINGTLYVTEDSVEFPYENAYSDTLRYVVMRILNDGKFYTGFDSGNLQSRIPALVTTNKGVVTRYPITFDRNDLAPGMQKVWINIVYASGNLYENILINGNYGPTGSIVKEFDGQRVKVDYTFNTTYIEITEVTHYDGANTRTLTGGDLYNSMYVRMSAYETAVNNGDVCMTESSSTMFPV